MNKAIKEHLGVVINSPLNPVTSCTSLAQLIPWIIIFLYIRL